MDSNDVLVERLWMPIRHEAVRLHTYVSVLQSKICVGKHLAFNDVRRVHSWLDRMTPDQFHLISPPQTKAV